MDRPACVDIKRVLDKTDSVEVLTILRAFSPNVEPKWDASIFWLDGSGIEALFGSVESWSGGIFERLKGAGFEPALVVGFTRFGTAAIARCSRGISLLPSREVETALVMQIPLRHMGLPEKTVLELSRLGKRTVSDLLSLPAEGLVERFGPAIRELFELAAGRRWDPLNPLPEEVPVTADLTLDYPETNATRLSFLAKNLLGAVLKQLHQRYLMLSGLEMVLEIDHADALHSRIEPAEPTLDEVQIADLIRLRLESLCLAAGVVGISLTARKLPATPKQLALFKKKSRRDKKAAKRALARIRAEFGPEAVMRARLRETHLPEARFALVPFTHIQAPSPGENETREGRLVRRIYRRPVPLQARPVVGPRGAHLLGMSEAPATRIHGPYVVSGGWWGGGVHREYYFTENENGEILWVYFDKRRRRWFIHGVLD